MRFPFLIKALALVGLSALCSVSAQDAVDLDWWSNRTDSAGVEVLTLAGQGEYLRLADTTSGFVEGSVTFGGPFLTIREWIYGVTAGPGGMPVGESIRLFVNGGQITSFEGLGPNRSEFDTFTAWGPSGNSTTVEYRIEFVSPSSVAAEHALFLRGRAQKRSFDIALGSPRCALSPNVAGPGAMLVAGGSASVGANDFTLISSGLPPETFALAIYGPQGARTPFGEGYLCVAGGGVGIVRLGPPQQVSPAGQFERQVDFEAPPANGGNTAILPGDVWFFQLWYRDGASFNTSESLRVSFQP